MNKKLCPSRAYILVKRVNKAQNKKELRGNIKQGWVVRGVLGRGLNLKKGSQDRPH